MKNVKVVTVLLGWEGRFGCLVDTLSVTQSRAQNEARPGTAAGGWRATGCQAGAVHRADGARVKAILKGVASACPVAYPNGCSRLHTAYR